MRVEKEYAPLYRSPGLGTTIWSPLASRPFDRQVQQGRAQGNAAGTPGMEWLQSEILKKPGIDEKLAAVPRLAAIAKAMATSLPCLAIASCLKNPNVSTVILGASRIEQLRRTWGRSTSSRS